MDDVQLVYMGGEEVGVTDVANVQLTLQFKEKQKRDLWKRHRQRVLDKSNEALESEPLSAYQ